MLSVSVSSCNESSESSLILLCAYICILLFKVLRSVSFLGPLKRQTVFSTQVSAAIAISLFSLCEMGVENSYSEEREVAASLPSESE